MRTAFKHLSASLITMSYLGADEAAHYGLMGPVKAALESLVRYLAMEMGQNGHRVHAMSPARYQPVPHQDYRILTH
jgi:enoyl-[acyl-carrier protein] reductase I